MQPTQSITVLSRKFPPTRTLGKTLLLLSALLCLASCTLVQRDAYIGKPLAWRQLDGWADDHHSEAWRALLQSCRALDAQAAWQGLCAQARTMQSPSDDDARRFFERWFTPHRVRGKRGAKRGLVTGYYEPLLFGKLSRDRRFRYPLYAAPRDLLTIDIESVYPQLQGERVRGRLIDKTVVPFYSRAEIDSTDNPLHGNELIWVDDRDAAFFLHIQGSGRVQLPDGNVVAVGYANQNGHPYQSIGRLLVEREQLELEETSLFTIRNWLRTHPREAERLLFENPSYVFFELRDTPQDGPLGSLNVPLTAERSIAVDPELIGLGAPVWLSTNYPDQPDAPYRRLMFAQDTGGAIRGALRADVFWGHGERAEQNAGVMREQGAMIVLLPNAAPHEA